MPPQQSPATATAEAPLFLELTRFVSATPERAFLAWTDPDLMKQWFGPSTHSCPTAEVDLRPGGRWRACMRSPEGNDHWAVGEYREIAPPSRLVFTWAWEMDGEAGHQTLITIHFSARDGGTEIVMRHEGFENEDSCNNHKQGWTSSFESLTGFLGA